eukprot:scaffold98510_cov21-Tisochrysis_lutea.AAC.2
MHVRPAGPCGLAAEAAEHLHRSVSLCNNHIRHTCDVHCYSLLKFEVASWARSMCLLAIQAVVLWHGSKQEQWLQAQSACDQRGVEQRLQALGAQAQPHPPAQGAGGARAERERGVRRSQR